MSTTAGLHVPVIPFVEVLGKTGTVPLLQITRLVPNGKEGVVLGVTVIVILIGNPHVFGAGVNVYVPEVILFTTAGLHVPAIPLLETGGKVGAVVPAQNGGIGVNVGTNIGSERMIPVNRFVVQPLIVNTKLE